MAITVREENYLCFGRCLYIANEKQQMRVTLDIGPRIISYNLTGKENMMFTDTECLSMRDNDEFKSVYGKDKAWYIYGGHRFWVSPEEYPITYYPDNGCSTEVFTNDFMLEMETLSPLYTLKGGEECSHLERWSLTECESSRLCDVVQFL